MARGQKWSAAYADSETGEIKTKKVSAGKLLQELVKERYPSLNPYFSSSAVSKDQGSSISVVDEDVYIQLCVSRERVDCRTRYTNTSQKRPKIVVCSPGDTSDWEWVEKRSIYLPTAAVLEASRSFFANESGEAAFPEEKWFQDDDLLGYRTLNVYPNRAISKTLKRHRLCQLSGWNPSLPSSVSQQGTRVLVQYGASTGYAEVVAFFRLKSGGPTVARVVWFSPVFDTARANCPALHPHFEYPLYRREVRDTDTKPAVVPVYAIKQLVFMKHACQVGNLEGVCRIEDRVVRHEAGNTLYMLCPSRIGN